MKERGILFNGEMVRAILDGRKTQTRSRPVVASDITNHIKSPFGQVGDRLYVRENFWCAEQAGYLVGERRLFYSADQDGSCFLKDGHEWKGGETKFGQHPSIHMPKWAARIWLEITNVKVERLQDISESDAKAEGVKGFMSDDSSSRWTAPFLCAWRNCYGEGSVDANPWVWAYTFKVLEVRS